MRRPLLYGAVFVLLAVLIWDMYGRVVLLLALLVLSFIYYRTEEGAFRKHTLLCLLFFAVGVTSCLLWDLDDHGIATASQEADVLEGEVLSVRIKEKEDRTSAKITIDTGENRILLTTFDTEIPIPGDRISFAGEVTAPEGRRNPGCFDYRRYLASKKVTGVVTTQAVTIKENGTGLRSRLYLIKRGFIQKLREKTDDQTASMTAGILFGEKDGIEEDVLTECQKNGTAHLLAVSGLHVGFLYAFFDHLWPWRRGRIHFITVSGLLWCYCIMADMSPSVVRASAMVVMHSFCSMTNRRYDLGSSGCAIIIIYIMSNPLSIYDPSLQMSFIAVMAMSLVAPYIKRFHDGVFTGSLAVQAGLLPYIAYTFNCIPLAAFLINIPLIALTGVIVPLGVCCLVMDSLSEGIPAAHELLSALIAILVKGNSLTCIDGRTTFLCRSPSPFLIAAFYLSLLVIFSENGRVLMARYGHRFLVLSITAVFCCSCIYAASMKTGFEKADLVFVDVGQGDCMHMKIDDSARLLFRDDVYHVLIDGGGRENYSVGEKTLKPYLLKNGTKKIDLALVTHLHTDHYDGIRTLCRMGMVRKLCVYEGYKVREKQILAECALKREDIVYVTAGDVIDLGDAKFEFLAPPERSNAEYARLDEDEEDENNKSLLIRASYHGVSVMMTGDIGMEGEEQAMKQRGKQVDFRCDILKVGHHGSKYSTGDGFLDAVCPEAAVIQVGRNNYGHPTPETLEKLAERSIPVFRNDLQGAVGVVIKGESIGRMITSSKKYPIQ